MEETISLNQIFEVIKKRFKIIISSTVIMTLLVAIVSLFVLTPIYEASSQFIVNEPVDEKYGLLDENRIRSNVDIINTYNVIITSPVILDDVIEKLNLPYDASTLADKITVSSEQDSQVVTVVVEDPYQKVAAAIVNEVVTIFQEKTPQIMDVDNVSVLTEAEAKADASPVKPTVTLNIAIGLLLGLMIGVGIAFLLEYLDTSIKTEKDIERQIGVPVLGTISTIDISDLDDQTDVKVENNPQRSRK